MRADNAIRVSLPRGSYESLPVLCDEAVDCRRQPPLISATKMRGGARDEGSTIRVGIGNDVEIPFDTPLVAPRYPAGKVALLLLENGLECIHGRALLSSRDSFWTAGHIGRHRESHAKTCFPSHHLGVCSRSFFVRNGLDHSHRLLSPS